METEHRTSSEPKFRNRDWRRCDVRDVRVGNPAASTEGVGQNAW
jgi:hypothetical protein